MPWMVAQGQDKVVISELMTNSLGPLVDEDGDSSDWIEFYNPTASSENLVDQFITDDRRNLRKWKVPSNVIIPSKGHKLIFASGKNRGSIFTKIFHTNFELADDGEYLALVAPDGEKILHEYANKFPRQRQGLSYGISNNDSGGTTLRYFESPTPEVANGEGREDLPPRVADTKFSIGRGFYDSPIEVAITTATPDATIYYSTNGTDPGPGSVFKPGKRYTAPIAIDKTTMLRARAFKKGLEPTDIDTHTYLFIASVLEQADVQDRLPTKWNGQNADYGMDPDVVDDPAYKDRMNDAFLALPTLSVVTNSDNFWAQDGLYLNTTRSSPNNSGADFKYEFEVSAELIHSDGSRGFQIQCGIRAQGGASRNADRSPKHAMSLRFRRAYGEGRLNYPIIKDSPQTSFDAVHLRARYNNSWIHNDNGQRTRGQLIRDQWARDSMIDMGTISAGHGSYMHLYLNGLYWGIYGAHERMDNAHYADYYGGRSDEVDAVNGGRATAGDLTSYRAMQDSARDGDWDEITARLDIDNYIDWHIIQRFGSNRDWKNDGNWKAAGGGPSNRLWRFYAWDTERILENVNESVVPGPSNDPSRIFNALMNVPEFVVRFGDRAHKHLFNGGALTVESNITRWMERAEEQDLAIIAESARWGDSKRSNSPFTRDDEWINEQNRLINAYFPARTDIVIDKFQDAGLYPDVKGVELNQHGGRVTSDFQLTLKGTGFSLFSPGKVFYALGGADPRATGGDIAAEAVEYSSAITLTESTIVKTRGRTNSGSWSAVSEVFFAVGTTPASSGNTVISEIMYHPGAPTAEESAAQHLSSDDFEYVELTNVSVETVDLSGCRFNNGIDLQFVAGPNAVLVPGASLVVVRDTNAFAFRYGDETPVAAVYAGNLNNDGETLRLVSEAGETIQETGYSDGGGWPQTADGSGFSLVLNDPASAISPDKPSAWRASTEIGGSPTASESNPGLKVVINEVLTNSAPPAVDVIELINMGSAVVDLSHWFLTDDPNTPHKFVIPTGTSIEPNEYVLISEDNDADPANNGALPAEFFGKAFALSSNGDEVYLFSANADGSLTGYSQGFSFRAADEGVSFGRQVDSQGHIEYPAQSTPSLGAANAGPLVNALVISEIFYHSNKSLADIADAGEFLEITNNGSGKQDLSGWEIAGIGYSFPGGTSLAAAQSLVISKVGAEAFQQLYPEVGGVTVLGPYSGKLSNNGERISLRRPGQPYTEDGVEKTPMIDVDSVRYNDAAPWPEVADGLGKSLERISLTTYADELANWRASAADNGSPGSNENGGPIQGTAYASWLSQSYTSDQVANNTLANPNGDADSDGLSNFLEYALNSSLLVADDLPLAIINTGDQISVSYNLRPDIASITVTLEASRDMVTWVPAEVMSTEDAGVERTQRLGADQQMRFLRLMVQAD